MTGRASWGTIAAALALAVALGAGACAAPRGVVAAAAGAAGDPDEDLPAGWLDGLPPDDAPVGAEEGRALVEQLFALLDRRIFDPAFRKEERDRARARLLALAEAGQTRATLAGAVDAALQGTGMSHLRFLRPEQLRKLEGMLAAPSAGRDAAMVEAERTGEIGVLRLKTFLVPSIRRALVEQALAQLQGCRALLLDLRGNGGGSMSSAVYVLEHVLGPDQLVARARFRSGLGKPRPFVQHGALPDAGNEGSGADVALVRREGLVEWRTARDARRLPVPVYALVDGACGSSCDAVAAALRDHHAARLLGARTAGALLAGIGVRPPWKGHLLLVPAGTIEVPSGAVVEGVGVAPDVELPACAARAGASCLEAALQAIRVEVAGSSGR